jgi:hypothetical protein
MRKFILSFVLLECFVLNLVAQNDPMKGQDTLVLELERNEWLPESQKFSIDLPKINLNIPTSLPFVYHSDSFIHAPKIIQPHLKVEGLQKPTMERLYQGLVDISFSSLLQPNVLVNVNQGRTTSLDWGITGNYQGLYKNYVPNAKRNFVNLNTHLGWHKDIISFQSILNLERMGFNYFGDSTYREIQPAPDTIQSHYSVIGWNNRFTYGNQQNGLYCQTPFSVVFYQDGWKNQELHFITEPKFTYAFVRYTIGIEGKFHQVSLDSKNTKDSRFLFAVQPYGEVKIKKLKLKMGILYSQADSLSYFVPTMEANYQLYPKLLSVFTEIKGESSLNSFYETKRRYPYIEGNFYRQSSITPWKIQAGAKLNYKKIFLQGLGYYQKVNNYRIIYAHGWDDTIQNRWVQQGYLTAIYDAGAVIYGVDFSGEWNNQENIKLVCNVNYQKWKLQNYEYNFHQPQLRINFEAITKINKKIELFSKISYISDFALGYLLNNQVIKQKAVFLGNVKICFHAQKFLDIYMGANNLLNQKYYFLRDYQELPIHGYAGVRVLF